MLNGIAFTVSGRAFHVHLRITKNTGGGFFSDEWIAVDDIFRLLKNRPQSSPVMSHFISPVLKGKSVTRRAFILTALTHLKLIRPLPKKKRLHELLDPKSFLDQMEKLTTYAGNVKIGVRNIKKTTRKSPSKKAAAKKRTTARNPLVPSREGFTVFVCIFIVLFIDSA